MRSTILLLFSFIYTNCETIPETFDCRQAWPECPSIGQALDEGSCHVSWAFAAAAVITDRNCIASNAKNQNKISVEDLISCTKEAYGCLSSDSKLYQGVLEVWNTTGVVSDKCRPYTAFDSGITPKCVEKCVDSNLNYKNDKTFGSKPLFLNYDTTIQLDMIKNGPVYTFIRLYPDFLNINAGIYYHDRNDKNPDLGFFSIKLLGWGTKKINNNDTIPYWLANISWGPQSGEHNGFFKIVRGNNTLFVESNAVSSVPILTN